MNQAIILPYFNRTPKLFAVYPKEFSIFSEKENLSKHEYQLLSLVS